MTREQTYPDILTAEELSMFLRCSTKTALSYIKKGLFPNSFKIGKSWRIPKDDVLNFINQ